MRWSGAVFAVVLWGCQTSPSPAVWTSRPLDQSMVAGFQGWFNAAGDGSTVRQWVHWARGAYGTAQGPAPGSVTFDLYPDTSSYPVTYPAGLGPRGDGTAARLYSDYDASTLAAQVGWMAGAGVDALAVQRFLAPLGDPVFRANLDHRDALVFQALESGHRGGFVMYDLSGAAPASGWVDRLLDDVDRHLLGEGLVASPAWTKQAGRPVIAVWGIGFPHTETDPQAYLRLIDELRHRGFWVLGGVPTFWRQGINDSLATMDQVYSRLDGLSPWMVGRFGTSAEALQFAATVQSGDLAVCRLRSQFYLPVLWPGFGWGNWNGGAINAVPRNQGQFVWDQALGARRNGLRTAYLAMWDEYDESTAWLPAARDSLDLPVDQDFLTHSADGVFLGGDYYLRLSGQIGRLLAGSAAVSPSRLPASLGPTWWRTSFETRDAAAGRPSLADIAGVTGAHLAVESWGSGPRSGVHLTADDQVTTRSVAYWSFQPWPASLAPLVHRGDFLRYRFQPRSPMGRYVAVDLQLRSPTGQVANLRDSGVTDTTGRSAHPGAGRGTLDTWEVISVPLDSWAGWTVENLLVAYDQTPLTGPVDAWVDWVSLTSEAQGP